MTLFSLEGFKIETISILVEIYCHENVLHFEITEYGKSIFSHYFTVSLPHTTQIFLEIDGGDKRN